MLWFVDEAPSLFHHACIYTLVIPPHILPPSFLILLEIILFCEYGALLL